MNSRLRLARMLGAAPRGLVAATALVAVVAGLLPVALILAGGLLSHAIVTAESRGDRTVDGVVGPFVLVMGLFLAGEVLGPVQGRLRWLVTKRVDGRLRERVVAAALAGEDLSHVQGAELISAMGEVQGLVRWSATPGGGAAGVVGLMRDYLTAIAATVVLAWYQPLVGLAVLAAALVMRVRWRRAIIGIIDAWGEAERPRRESWYFTDLGLGRPARFEVRLFGLGSWLGGRLTLAGIAAWTPTWERRRSGMGRNGLLHLVLVGAATVGGLIWAAEATASGTIGVADLVVFVPMLFTLLVMAGSSPEDMAVQYGLKSLPAVETLERAAASARLPGTGRQVDTSAPPEIEFEGVSFAYPGGSAVLDGIDLRLPAGSSLAVVGLNGAGKTTLVRLLCGLYPPTHGRVLVNGEDLAALSLSSWHRLIAPMFQGFLRMPGTVVDNVAVGAVGHTGDGIASALADAGASTFASRLPERLDTVLATPQIDGTDLSGGQWQRLAQARALYALQHGARLLVLDEPTSNLDTGAEERLVRRLVEATAGEATTVLVTHRLALARRCDRIVVIDQGRVVEQGSHEELVASGGRYAEAFGAQAAMYPWEAADD